MDVSWFHWTLNKSCRISPRTMQRKWTSSLWMHMHGWMFHASTSWSWSSEAEVSLSSHCNIWLLLSRYLGDVQPYLALAKKLKEDGHRIRIATHEAFRSFVKDAGFEFFCIGGDPKELMSYMVKSACSFCASSPLLILCGYRSGPHAWHGQLIEWWY